MSAGRAAIAGSAYPRSAPIACTLLQTGADDAGAWAEIDTSEPWGIWSVDNCSRFQVAMDQIGDHDD